MLSGPCIPPSRMLLCRFSYALRWSRCETQAFARFQRPSLTPSYCPGHLLRAWGVTGRWLAVPSGT